MSPRVLEFGIALTVAFGPILRAESFLFTFDGAPEYVIEGDEIRQTMPIKRLETPEASSMTAFHQGLGEGRAYAIQVNLTERPSEDWMPRVKLGEDILLTEISVAWPSRPESAGWIKLESGDREQAERWVERLAALFELPPPQVSVNLAKGAKDEEADAAPAGGGENEQPLEVEAGPEWSIEYQGDGVSFYSLSREDQDDLHFMFSRWPAPGGRDQIPELVEKIAEGLLAEAKDNDEIQLAKHDYKIEILNKGDFPGRAAVFETENDELQTMFFISDGRGLWNGQFGGSASVWAEAKEILAKLRRNDG